MGRGKFALTYEDALKLVAEAPEVLKVLLENAPGKSKPDQRQN